MLEQLKNSLFCKNGVSIYTDVCLFKILKRNNWLHILFFIATTTKNSRLVGLQEP